MDATSKPLKRKKNSVIDTEPTLNTSENPLVKEEVSQLLEALLKAKMTQSECDWLINHGLGDKNKITFYRLTMQNPMQAINTPQYRAYAGEILEKLLGIIRGDNFMWNRLKTLLQQEYHGFVEEFEDTGRKEDEDDEDNDDDEEEKEKMKVEYVTLQQIRSLLKKD